MKGIIFQESARWKKPFLVLLSALFVVGLLSGCSEDKSGVEKTALRYTEAIMTGDWETAAGESAGEQLGVMLLLSEQLAQTKFTADLRLNEVIETEVDGKKAHAIVHVVRDMSIQEFGSVTDDRQLMLDLYEVDGKWKVYRVDVLFEQ
ncbi:hypothetical protein ACFYKX_10130 [Cytobacillus sp. FJAT-54145]|uniref:DUF4878 domain-containing protein n=1 Tax=Cytobacillus spartinae TaxID=3299023 RepID=A0ABW6KB65_9BACI